MAKTAMRRVFGVAKVDASVLTDAELLRRFADDGDQAAFATLVRRHTSLVLGVCRRSLPAAADAEDACQAVFVVLARKAKGTRWQSSVASWLYTTARKVSKDARIAVERRIKREGKAGVPEATPPVDQMTARELFDALDDELDRLPPIYREPLVLCYLEGLSREDAAARLGVPAATVKTRLERGRKRLGEALTRRGVAVGLGLLALAATSPAGASPSALMASVLSAVNGSPSPAVAALAQGAAVNGFLTRTKVLALVGLVTVGFGLAAVFAADPPKTPDKMEKPKADAKVEPKKAEDEVKERTITGKVTGPDGKPILADLAMHWVEGTVEPLGKSNADGTFKVTVPLHKKDLGGHLVASAAGCGPDFHHHGYDWLSASVTPTADLAFKLPKERTIKGRIISQEGKPVAGATVAASEVSAYDSDASLDAHLKKWAERADGNPLGHDRGMQYPKAVRPPSTTTDADGRFELAGYGVGQTVQLKLSGDGIATKGLVYVNRDGFDPAPFIEAAIRNAGKNRKFNPRWVVCGPGFTAVVEPEKLFRGTVTDHLGKPRAGARVQASRTTSDQLTDHWYWHEATTDKDGRYVIRGVRKYPAYMVEVDGDPASGQLPCLASAQDTIGYEPITLDAKSEQGVVVTGTLTDKATGKPIRGGVLAAVIDRNPMVKQYPMFLRPGASGESVAQADRDGAFRLVTIPGPVLLIAHGSRDDSEYKPPIADPDYPQYFAQAEGAVVFDRYLWGRRHINGCWCKVLNAKSAGDELAVKVELEPATKTLVRVVDADGEPVTGVQATGLEPREYAHPVAFPDTDRLTVLNLDAKKERLLAVVHAGRKLVGTLPLTADTKDPVVKLGAGGSVTGRAVGKDGKPLVGLAVNTRFTHRQATEAFNAFHRDETPITDANGDFRVDGLFPGQEFKLYFTRDRRSYGLEVDPTPAYTLAKPGETRKIGELVMLIDHE